MNVLTLLRADLGTDGVDHDRIRQVAKDANINYYTLRKLAKGYSAAPSFVVAEKLREYYAKRLASGHIALL